MGDVKNQMKPTDKSSDKAKTVFGKLAWKKKNSTSSGDSAQSFADTLLNCHQTIGKLIATKEGELKSESGRENYNSLALSRLKAMEFHIESTLDLASDYAESN